MIREGEPTRFYFGLTEEQAIEITKREVNAVAYTTNDRVVCDGRLMRGKPEWPAAMKLRYVETVKDLPRCAHQMPGDDSRGALRLLCGKKKDAEHDLETTGWVCLADKHIYMWAHGEGDTLDGLYKDLGSFGGEGAGEPPHYIKEAEVVGANAERLILTEKNGNTIAFEPFSNFNKTALEKARKVAKGTVLANQIDDLHQIGDNGVYMVEAYRGTTLEVGLLVVVEDMRSLVHQYYFGAMNPADWRPLTTDDQEGIYTRRYENGSWSEWKLYGGGSAQKVYTLSAGRKMGVYEQSSSATSGSVLFRKDLGMPVLETYDEMMVAEQYANWANVSPKRADLCKDGVAIVCDGDRWEWAGTQFVKLSGGSDIVDLGEFERSGQGEAKAAEVEYAGNADILMMSYTITGAGKAIIHQTVNESRSTQFLVLGGFWFTRYITFTDDSRTAISQVTAWWRTMPTNVEYNAGTRRVRLVDYNRQHSLPLNSANDGFELPLADGATDGLMSKEDKSKLDGISGGANLAVTELNAIVSGSPETTGITYDKVMEDGLSYDFVFLKKGVTAQVVLRTYNGSLPIHQQSPKLYSAYSGFEKTPEEWNSYLIKSYGDIWRYTGGEKIWDRLTRNCELGVIHFKGTTTLTPDLASGTAPDDAEIYYNESQRSFVAVKSGKPYLSFNDQFYYGTQPYFVGITKPYTGKLYIDADNNLWHSVDGTSLVKVTT